MIQLKHSFTVVTLFYAELTTFHIASDYGRILYLEKLLRTIDTI
jgi:hypothetical protein